MARPSKKRKIKESKTEEVVFDPALRFEYLTGFHKRKVERTKHAQEAAARRAREEKIEQRKQLREERKAERERHVKEVNALLPSRTTKAESDGSDDENVQDEWAGIPEPEAALVDHEEEYIDEDRYTTVTVEEVDVSRDGLARLRGSDDDENEEEANGVKEEPAKASVQSKPKKAGPGSKKDKLGTAKKKKKKKRDFKYESKADRKLNRLKVQAKNSKQARARRGD